MCDYQFASFVFDLLDAMMVAVVAVVCSRASINNRFYEMFAIGKRIVLSSGPNEARGKESERGLFRE